jgi:hypothetical protein
MNNFPVEVFLVVAALIGFLAVISICWCIFLMYEKITKLIDERVRRWRQHNAMVLTWSALAAKADDDDGKVTGGVVFYLTSMPRGLVSVVI